MTGKFVAGGITLACGLMLRAMPILIVACCLITSITQDGNAQSVPATAITVGTDEAQSRHVLRDGYGREITLRGFNVSGSSKLAETGFLPFRSTSDAVLSAQALRDQTGSNVVRFLVIWEGVQPTSPSIDTNYLARATQQIKTFTDRGFYVLLDFHQDLYSRHLFNADSWHTGDGAPAWVIEAGAYPEEYCGIVCAMWGQNMLTNAAVRGAMYDFWHNRMISTSAGAMYLQDIYLEQARQAMIYLREHLPASSFTRIIGVDPFNEPYDGGLDGASGTSWEENFMMPFYRRFRTAMDEAGWTDKLALIEPLVFWNSYGVTPEGGFSTIGELGPRYVFNAHYYDGARMTINPFGAGDGAYASAMKQIRDRAKQVATAGFVSETGFSMEDSRTPVIIRALYGGLDQGGKSSDWWASPVGRGPVLSATLWQWDMYNGRHHEVMNGNPNKIQVEADGWNGEDFSFVALDASGKVAPRVDSHLIDRVYPSAVGGDTLAFATEDLASSGFAGSAAGSAWLTVPSSLPNIRALVQGRRYGVLVWRETEAAKLAPTELHLPASFASSSTIVISDLGTVAGLPSSGVIAVATETGSVTARRLLLTSSGTATGTIHVALIIEGAGLTPSSTELAVADSELLAWRDAKFQ